MVALGSREHGRNFHHHRRLACLSLCCASPHLYRMSLDLSPEAANSMGQAPPPPPAQTLVAPGLAPSQKPNPPALPPGDAGKGASTSPRQSPASARSPSPSFRRRAGSPSRPRDHGSPPRRYADKDVCRNYLRGNCRRGDSCPFLHPIYPEGERPLPPPRTREVCRDFARGDCPRGLRCIYSHEIHGREICRDYARGNCTRLNCHFVHARNGRTVESLPPHAGGAGASAPPPPPPPPAHAADDDHAYARKRPRYEYDGPPSPLRSISSSELSYLLSLKEEANFLREENHYLRGQVRFLRHEVERYAPPAGPSRSDPRSSRGPAY